MSKSLKVLLGTVLGLALVVALGCATAEKSAPKEEPAPVAEAPAEETAPPAPVQAPAVSSGGSLASIGIAGPESVNEGDMFQSTVSFRANEDVENVIVRVMVPEGLEYVKSDPAAKAEGSTLIWSFPTMSAGETKSAQVWFKPLKKGSAKTCATIEATARNCYVVNITKPAISIQKSGPETAMLGDMVSYTVLVKNEGDGPARNVVVVDDVPKGLTHESGKSQLTYEIGDLGAQQSKTIVVNLKAAERGKHCNKASVDTENAGKADSTACTTVMLEDLQVYKAGLPEQYINKTAGYVIVVTNAGDTTLQNIQVVDTAPANTAIVGAEGGTVSGNKAVWTIASLGPGAVQTLTVTLTSTVPGSHCNNVSAAVGSLARQAEACTLWKGYPAILIEVVDTDDPLQIGEETTYLIRVTNQGSADDNNIQIVAQFPKEVTPLSAAGDTAGTVAGDKVTFEPYKTLAPKQAITWQIRAKGSVVGDGRIKVHLTSAVLKSPVLEEESTHVY